MRPELAQDPARRAARLLWQALRPEARHVWICLAWLLTAGALDTLGPALGKAFIDRYLVPQDPALGTMVGLVVGVFVSGCAATWLRHFQLVRLGGLAMRSVARIRDTVHQHVLRLPMAYFDSASTGALVSRVTNDTEAVRLLYVQVLFVMLDCLVMVSVLLVTMALLDWRLMLIAATLVPAVLIVVAVYRRLSAPAVARSRELRGQLNAHVAESIGGMTVLQATGASARYADRYAALNEAHWRARIAELRANAWLLRPALDLLGVAMLIGIITAFGLRAPQGTLEVGVLYAFVSYIGRVTEPLIQLTTQFSQLQQSVVAAARVSALLDEPRAPQPAGLARITDGAIRFSDLSFCYTPGSLVVQAIRLDIAPGEFLGIVGPTGSGKSTLLALLLRLYPVSPGTLSIDGHPVHDIDEEAFRTAVALVPQDPFLLAGTVRENIAMGRPLSADTLEAAARAAGAHDFIAALPDGYDTPLGEGGSRLATGEKQLIAIARALAGDPRILLLDEATAHIDTATEQQVLRSLAALRGRLTIVSVAHRLATVRDAHRIAVVNHGRIVELGSHDALMENESGLYRRMVELQRLSGLDTG